MWGNIKERVFMKRLLVSACLFILLLVSCTQTAHTSGSNSHTALPPLHILYENPPVCSNARLIYHTQLHQMLMTGCVSGTVKENIPNVIWGYNGTGWHKVTEGGPQMRVLADAAYDEKRNVVVQYGGRPMDSFECVRETWEWDTQPWAQKQVQSPFACDHFAMVYDHSKGAVILFGGRG